MYSEKLAKLVYEWLWIFIFFATAVFFVGLTPYSKDDTDIPGWGMHKSGVIPVKDHKTGCQYLRTSGGGITPRMDTNGNHICN